jgi:hypothetical protein
MVGTTLPPQTATDCRETALLPSAPVAWSCDEPHDQSDKDEEEQTHRKQCHEAHGNPSATHHGELLLRLFGISGMAQVSRMRAAKPTNW